MPELTDVALDLLLLVRLGRWKTEIPEVWSEVTLVAIPKNTARLFQATRYISLRPVLQKLYVRAMLAAIRRERQLHETNILVFEPGGCLRGGNHGNFAVGSWQGGGVGGGSVCGLSGRGGRL